MIQIHLTLMKESPKYLEYRLMRHGEETEVCDLVMRVFDEFRSYALDS